MKKHTIELFMPYSGCEQALENVKGLLAAGVIERAWLWSASATGGPLPAGVEVLTVESLSCSALFRDMAERATADFVLYFGKENLTVDAARLLELCAVMPQGSSMAYSDHYKVLGGERVEAPVIDYFAGSLRNDFDFGSLLLFRTSSVKGYFTDGMDEFDYAGLYQLRLAMSRVGSLFHYKEYLYTEEEDDTRKSGEKQFDYVNPAQRAVQVEMEDVCTAHLKAIGAWLPPCKYERIDLAEGEFPVEASVIIPVLNRESTISDAIASVLSQKTDFLFNILVVDNHSTDRTGEIIDSFADSRVVHIVPERTDLGIGGCWQLAVNSAQCGRFAVQLDSDDIYSGNDTLQRIVDEFYAQQCAMLVGTYRICDFELNTLPPGIIDHREWTEENGRNNALRINGLGAPRAFYTPVIREVGFPNVSYGEDYAVGLQISRRFRIGRIYDVLYLCRRWGGNSDAALSHAKVNAHNLYKDSLRTTEVEARIGLVSSMSIPSSDELAAFFTSQLKVWDDASARYAALENVKVRDLGNGISLQYNPARIVSTGAKVDATSVAERKCFLCAGNRPAVQNGLVAMGTLDVLVNPFPILPFHLTLPVKEHVQQMLEPMYADMLHVAHEWPGMALFYNGAKCGASAPDHAHLQACRCADIPLLGEEWGEKISDGMEPLHTIGGSCIYKVTSYTVPLFMIVATRVSDSVELLGRLLQAMPLHDGECEPRMNVIAYHKPGEGYVTIVIPRAEHRPACYGETGDAQRLVSPGALDMAGLVITPREDDFLAITADEASGMLREVAITDVLADEIADMIV